MRSVKGLDRPGVQWALVLGCILLMILLLAATVTIVRMRQLERDAASHDADTRHELERLDGQLSRERAAREALMLELGRHRSSTPDVIPALTLEPSRSHQREPPPASVAATASQVVLLRLAVPSKNSGKYAAYEVTVRGWSDGRVRWSRNGLTLTSGSDGPLVTAYVTGEMFEPGAYEIVLSGTRNGTPEEVARYDVTVK